MNDQAGWRAWSGAWKVGAPPEDWWLSADGRWYPPGVQRPPGGPTWRGSAAEYRPRQFAEAGARTAGGVSVVTRSHRPGPDGAGQPPTAKHAVPKVGGGTKPPRAGSARAEVGSLIRTTIVVLAAALAAVIALALWSMRNADDTPVLPVDTSRQTTTSAPTAPTVLPNDAEVQRVPSA
jgi:hypothetical protein